MLKLDKEEILNLLYKDFLTITAYFIGPENTLNTIDLSDYDFTEKLNKAKSERWIIEAKKLWEDYVKNVGAIVFNKDAELINYLLDFESMMERSKRSPSKFIQALAKSIIYQLT